MSTLPERCHGDNVFQRRTRCRACGLGRVQRRANLRAGSAAAQARRSRALRFDTRERQQVGLKIGLSYVGGERAAEPRKEAARKDFDRVRREANATWKRRWAGFASRAACTMTARSSARGCSTPCRGRGLANDVNGAYPANDGTVGQIALDGAGRPVHD